MDVRNVVENTKIPYPMVIQFACHLYGLKSLNLLYVHHIFLSLKLQFFLEKSENLLEAQFYTLSNCRINQTRRVKTSIV